MVRLTLVSARRRHHRRTSSRSSHNRFPWAILFRRNFSYRSGNTFRRVTGMMVTFVIRWKPAIRGRVRCNRIACRSCPRGKPLLTRILPSPDAHPTDRCPFPRGNLSAFGSRTAFTLVGIAPNGALLIPREKQVSGAANAPWQ